MSFRRPKRGNSSQLLLSLKPIEQGQALHRSFEAGPASDPNLSASVRPADATTETFAAATSDRIYP